MSVPLKLFYVVGIFALQNTRTNLSILCAMFPPISILALAALVALASAERRGFVKHREHVEEVSAFQSVGCG